MEYMLIGIWGVSYPQIIAGLIGGCIGALIVNSKNVAIYGWYLTSLLVIGGIMAAGAMSEYLVYRYSFTYLFIHSVIGMVIAMLASSALDVLKVIAPPLVENLIRGTGETAKEIIIRKLKAFWRS